MLDIAEFVEQLGFKYQQVTTTNNMFDEQQKPSGIYLIFCGYGLVARCFCVQDHILVMLAGSEWVIKNKIDSNRTIEDIHTYVRNSSNYVDCVTHTKKIPKKQSRWLTILGLTQKEYDTLISCGFVVDMHQNKIPTEMDDTLITMKSVGEPTIRITHTDDVNDTDQTTNILALIIGLRE